MVEVRVLTVPLDPRTGLLDDGPLRAYLADREVLRSEPHFFVHEGRACCAVYLETRLRQGVPETLASRSSAPAPRPSGSPDAEREAFNVTLTGPDGQRSRTTLSPSTLGKSWEVVTEAATPRAAKRERKEAQA